MTITEEEQLTSLLTVPVVAGSSSCWHATICGFNSGLVRVFSESGALLLQKCFLPSPVRGIKVQSMPEGKHYTNILHQQTVLDLLIVYPTTVVSVTGTDLYTVLRENMAGLAMATARGLEESQLTGLEATRLMVADQTVSDCESWVSCTTSYNIYTNMTMRGGIVDDRHRPVHTLPVFLTCGAAPFLQYNDRAAQSYSTTQLASNMVTTVKSGLMKWWGREEVDTVKADREISLRLQHSVKDEGRTGLEMVISPNKLYTVVRDDKNRLMLVDNVSGVVVQAWRGYHRCQLAWAVTSVDSNQDIAADIQISVILIIYLPRRGLIEVWSPEQKSKVTEFHVSKHGTLLRSCLASLDDGIPRKRDTISLYCAFLQPTGIINQFFIPFHALSTSSSAEKDFQLQASLRDSTPDGLHSDNSNKVLTELLEVKNAQLRWQILSDILNCSVDTETVSSFLKKILNSSEEENISIENKIWRSKVIKLEKLVELYTELIKPRTEEVEISGSVEESLCLELMTDIDEIESLLEIIEISNTFRADDDIVMKASLSEVISCFEVDGDVNTDKTSIRLKKNNSPQLCQELYQSFSRIISSEKELALDLMQLCCLHMEDMTNLALQGCFHNNLNCDLLSVRRLYRTLSFFLCYNSNVDDKHRSLMQDLIKKWLRKKDMTSSVYLLATVWKCVLVSSNSSSVLMFAEEWSRVISQVRNFLSVKTVYTCLLSEAGVGEDLTCYSLSGVFQCGDGRLAELLSRWLIKLGVTSRGLVQELESVEDTGLSRRLLEPCWKYFPRSSDLSVLVLHLCWEHLQLWTRNRDLVNCLEDVVWSMWSVSSPSLRLKFLSLVWRTYCQELLRETTKLTEGLSRTVGGNKEQKCRDVLQMKVETVPSWLGRLTDLLDCHLQTLSLTTGLEEDREEEVGYDELSYDKSPHLLDHVRKLRPTDGDTVSLYHQLSAVLELSWTLRLSSRPSQLFTTAETHLVLGTQPGLMSSIFRSEHNTTVNKERRAWISMVTEASVGRIHCLPGQQRDTKEFIRMMEKLVQVSRVWFMSDFVRLCEVESLYRAGHDDLASENRTCISDKSSLR